MTRGARCDASLPDITRKCCHFIVFCLVSFSLFSPNFLLLREFFLEGSFLRRSFVHWLYSDPWHCSGGEREVKRVEWSRLSAKWSEADKYGRHCQLQLLYLVWCSLKMGHISSEQVAETTNTIFVANRFSSLTSPAVGLVPVPCCSWSFLGKRETLAYTWTWPYLYVGS